MQRKMSRMPKFMPGDINAIRIQIENGQKLYMRYVEGAKLYSMGMHSFRDMAKAAGAVRKLPGLVLVNVKKINEYIEIMYGPLE